MMQKEIFYFLLVVIFAYSFGFAIGFICFTPKITAMDVYEGKTTLKITYIDGVPVDSIVVFKDKEK